MGVGGLTTFVDELGIARRVTLRAPADGQPPKQSLVVDGNGCLRRLYNPSIDWVRACSPWPRRRRLNLTRWKDSANEGGPD